MDKYLIINADDFGMCRAANMAVADLFQKGGITSATIMTPCGWAKNAGIWAKNNPEHAVGVHLTFTSEWGEYRWGPVAENNTSSLRDSEGFMHHESDQFEETADLDEVEAEIRAQIERFKSFGIEPSHLDNHMGSLYGIATGRLELLQLIFDIAAEYKLPFRFPGTFIPEMMGNEMLDIQLPEEIIKMAFSKFTAYAKDNGVLMPDYLIPGDWSGPWKDDYELYREYIYELYRSFPAGVTETYIHPAFECDELKAITGSWQRRVWEHKLFSDPKTLQHIKALGIELISYKDLARIKG